MSYEPEREPEESGSALDEPLRELFRLEAESEEPSAEELGALVRGDLDEEEADRLLERVAEHPEAMDLLLELRGAAQHEGGTEALSASEVSAGVEAVLARTEPPQRSAPPPVLRWLAALLILGLSGFAFEQYRQVENGRERSARAEERLRDLRARIERAEARLIEAIRSEEPRPLVNLPIVDLFSFDRLRGEDSLPEPVIVDADRALVLILTPRDPLAEQPYVLSFAQAEGDLLWQGEVRADPAGLVTLTLPEGFLGVGRWRVELAREGEVPERFELDARSTAPEPTSDTETVEP